MKVSPKYIIELTHKIENNLWNLYSSNKYHNVEAYLERARDVEREYYDGYVEADIIIYDFEIVYKDGTSQIDLKKTLKAISEEKLFKIAVDLGIEVPGLIYSIPEIKGLKADEYSQVSNIFESALKKVYSDPDVAITMANSALETIIKHICEDNRIKECNPKHTLGKLIEHIVKEFEMAKKQGEPLTEINQIASGLVKSAKIIEDIRSNKTTAHGKNSEDYLIDDPLYAMFIINSVTTVGLFLINYYEKKFKNVTVPPFDYDYDEDIPF